MLSYVPAARRAGVAALWRLDERLGAVLATTTAPALGAVRLAWWRDALTALDHASPPAEPLLTELAAHVLPSVGGQALAGIAEGWGLLLDPGHYVATRARYGAERGGALFLGVARLLGGEHRTLAASGAGWALVDLAFRVRDPALAARALSVAYDASAEPGGSWPSRLRPLGMLAMLARRDAAAGLARPRRQGSPARLARMLGHRLTGR